MYLEHTYKHIWLSVNIFNTFRDANKQTVNNFVNDVGLNGMYLVFNNIPIALFLNDFNF